MLESNGIEHPRTYGDQNLGLGRFLSRLECSHSKVDAPLAGRLS
jgi:hypothetical protein